MRKVQIQLDDMMPLIRDQLAEGKTVTFTPRGVSMRPTIKGGEDQVVLGPLPPRLKKYDMPLYRRDNGQYVLHRVVAIDAERTEYTMMGDNQYHREHIREDQLIGVVYAVVKNGKEKSVDRLAFRLYSRFWHYSRPVRHVLVYGITRIRSIGKKKTGDPA